jgi:membrane protein YqaA with SNARE-associated domain
MNYFVLKQHCACFDLHVLRRKIAMNPKCIAFCGLVTCVLGAMLGFGIAEVNREDTNPNAHAHYATIGSVIGLLVGAGQETLRQRAREELN